VAHVTIQMQNIGAVNLERSFDAFMAIPSELGGFVGAVERIEQFDIDAYHRVIELGSGASVSEGDVFATGMESLRTPLLDYLDLLAGGPIASLGE